MATLGRYVLAISACAGACRGALAAQLLIPSGVEFQLNVVTVKLNGVSCVFRSEEIDTINIYALGGNDTIGACDGRVEIVDGGSGTDTAIVDSNDAVSNVETKSFLGSISGRIFNDVELDGIYNGSDTPSGEWIVSIPSTLRTTGRGISTCT